MTQPHVEPRRLVRLLAVVAITATAWSGPVGGADASPAEAKPSAAQQVRSESTGLDRAPAEVVASAPTGRRLHVVVTTRTSHGPSVESRAAKNTAAARAMVQAAQDDDATVAVGMAQPMRITATDPLRSKQWALAQLSATAVWSRTRGKGVTVAVVDTGVEANHKDLGGRVLSGWDVTKTPAGRGGTTDPNGHGTHLAGIIAATAGNGIGVAGLAPLVRVLPVRVADRDGLSSSDLVARGVTWAADHGAQVINLSLGGTGDDPNLAAAVAYAESRNIVVVAAAGNAKQMGNPRVYPASYGGVLGVGAIDIDGRIAPFSGTGSFVDVVAPGVGVLSTYPTQSYKTLDGTSMAAPYVAATAALGIASTGSGYAASAVTAQIMSTASDRGVPGRDNTFGHGLISPLRLVDAAQCPPSDVDRICGRNRYATAANLSSATFSSNVATAYVTSGTEFADALGGGVAAAREGAPLLLTRPTTLPAETATELRRLRPRRIVVLGGPSAVSASVLSALRGLTTGATVRVAGVDRYATAAATAGATFPSGATTAFVASGEAFPDALSGAPAATKANGPLLLTRRGALPATAAKALDDLGVDNIVVLGGTGSVSSRVLRALKAHGTVRRVQGTDRYATSAAVAAAYFPGRSSSVFLASGTSFPDALAGSTVAGGVPAPLLLTRQGSLPGSTRTELDRLGARRIVLLGSVGAISETVRRQVE